MQEFSNSYPEARLSLSPGVGLAIHVGSLLARDLPTEFRDMAVFKDANGRSLISPRGRCRVYLSTFMAVGGAQLRLRFVFSVWEAVHHALTRKLERTNGSELDLAILSKHKATKNEIWFVGRSEVLSDRWVILRHHAPILTQPARATVFASSRKPAF